ncbi:MAG: glycosyltransferase family 2 protein [Anaerolineae bacterium]|jgi:GT2 family glycosyltransferase|nr:glycosyltransferase family 2 protein [Anaerolineae bacterium]
MNHDDLPRVSVIIPNWNGAQHLPVCLDSLRRQTYPVTETIVVDNASQDASLSILRSYPEVRVLPQTTNLGFTGGCNAGLRAAKGTIRILLNNDTEAHPEWIAAIVKTFADHPEAGLVASKMLLFDRRDMLHTAGDYVTPDGLAHNRGVWVKDMGQYNHRGYVFSACGGSAAYRSTMLDEIGLLDEDFFFSFEDVDLAWRAQLAGWRCVFEPSAVVYHKLKASGGGATASYYDGRNRIYTLVKNYPADLWRTHRREVVAAQWDLVIAAAKAWRGPAARATLRGIAAGILGIPRMLRKRRIVQATRGIVDRVYLERLMQPPYEIRIDTRLSPAVS